MSRYFSYINSAKHIIENYDGNEPLARYLKAFFAKSKKYGSKDRKQIAMLCYQYYRVGLAFKSQNLEEDIINAHYFCSNIPTPIINDIHPILNETIQDSIEEKFKILPKINILDIFPFQKLISDQIDHKLFVYSLLKQPRLFIRLRPDFEKTVLNKLNDSELRFEKVNSTCISFENGTKIEEILEVGQEVIIQDYNSQQVGLFIQQNIPTIQNPKLSIWDCCAASGGKSIMLFDQNNKINLTVSDIRASILQNLVERFQQAGIQKYHSLLVDLTLDTDQLAIKHNFDIVIADVPCTGSGTWARTPEQLHFFDEKNIENFVRLQQSIVRNAAKYLAIKGYFIYITCSIFEQENENNVKYLTNKVGLNLVSAEVLKGYEKEADSMFVAIFQK